MHVLQSPEAELINATWRRPDFTSYAAFSNIMDEEQEPRDEALLELGCNTRAICLNQSAGSKNKVPTALGITLVHDMPRKIIQGQMVLRSQVKTQKYDKPSFKRLTTSDCPGKCMKTWQDGWFRDCTDAQRPMHEVPNGVNAQGENKFRDWYILTTPV